MTEWEAEVTVDEALVRALLAEQARGVPVDRIRLLGEGWDNAVWLVDERFVFRFPRRGLAIPGLERELRVLPALASRLPLPIPSPVYVGRPSARFPWPFYGARYLPGRELSAVALAGSRVRFGRVLGAFLNALHAPDLLAELSAGLPEDVNRRSDMAFRVPRTHARLEALERLGLWQAPPTVSHILEDAAGLGPAGGRAIVHGDLHVRHVLVDDSGTPSAVIDWGDAGVADPSVDLSLYWSVLDAPGRAAFMAAYGPVPAHGLLRARVLALFLNAALAEYAHQIGLRGLLAEALAGLERTVSDAPAP
jgi:aminoglycoside phosphotransferase (APT) family kinase protein